MKIKYTLTLLLLAFSYIAQAQQLDSAEYFFDTDPGLGKGKEIRLSGSSIDSSISIDLTGVTTGLHTLYIRLKNSKGNWGLSYSGSVLVNSGTGGGGGIAQLTSAEYYFDNDPGLGNGRQITLVGTVVDSSFNFDLTGITTGLHTLYVRFKNSDGSVGLSYQYSLQVTNGTSGLLHFSNAEYFFDKDPGVGNGKKLSLVGGIIDTTLNFDVTGLPPGGHVLYIRLQNSLNYWSINYEQNIFLPLNGNTFQGLNYFLDTVKNTVSLPLNSTAFLDTTISIHIPDDGADNRILGLQLTGQYGIIGNAQLDTVSLCQLYKPLGGFRYVQYGSTFTLLDTGKYNPSNKVRWMANNKLIDSNYSINYLFPSGSIPGSTLISELYGTGCRVDTTIQSLNMTGVERYAPYVGSYNSDFNLNIYGGGLDSGLNIFLQKGSTIVYPYLKIQQDSAQHLIAVFDFHFDSVVNNATVPIVDGYQLHIRYRSGYEYIGADTIHFLKAFNANACALFNQATIAYKNDLWQGAIGAIPLDEFEAQAEAARCPPIVQQLSTTNSNEPYFTTDLTGPTNIRVGEWNNFTMSITNTGSVVAKGIPFYILVPAFFDIDTTQWNIFNPNPGLSDSISTIVNIDTIINGQPFQYKLIGMIYPVLAPGETGYFPLRIRSTTSSDYQIYYYAQSRMFGSPMTDHFGPCWGAALDFAIGFVPGLSCVYALGNLINDGVNSLYKTPDRPTTFFSWTLSIAGTAFSCIPGGAAIKQIAKATTAKLAEAFVVSVEEATKVGDKGLNIISNTSSVANSSDPCNPVNQDSKSKKGKTGRSEDPNNIMGNSDYDTTKNYINNYSPQHYAINFENSPAATANAQHIVIADTLEQNTFNFKSFSLSQFYIGDSTYSLPSYRYQVTKDVWLKNLKNMKARFTAVFDTTTGILRADLFTIDTSGNVLPTDSIAGFLPPDIDGVSGTAGLSYNLYARNLNTLDTFANKAFIYFDNNAPVATNSWMNTVDTTGPQTKILKAISITDSTAKLVIQQSDVGSGNKYNTLYGKMIGDSVFRDLGIAYGDTIIFQATKGETYQLFVMGTDNVNNKEVKDSVAEVIYTFGSGSLALLITSFTGQYLDGVDRLNTTVTNVVNVKTIELQKSIDGINFNFLGNMAVAPVSSGTYNYNDPNPVPGKNYYRLRIIDIDGQVTYSNVVVLTNDKGTATSVYPNPAEATLNISFKNVTPGKYILVLSDIVGRRLESKEAYLLTGNETEIFSLSGYAQGTYVLTVTDQSGIKVVNTKILKE